MSFLAGEAFLGVLLGFVSRYAYDWYRDHKNRMKLKQNLRKELMKCVSRLTGEHLLLPTIDWGATVAAGDVKLLPFDERRELSTIYFEIENHIYEAKRVGDSAIIGQISTPGRKLDGMSATLAYWASLSKHLAKEEQVLKRKISKLLEATWW